MAIVAPAPSTQSVPFIGLVGLTFKDGAEPVPPLECSDFVTNVRLSSGTPSLSGIIRRLPPKKSRPKICGHLVVPD